MAIEYNVSEDGFTINTFPRGVLNMDDTVDYFKRLSEDSRIKKGAVEIVNFKEVTDFKIYYAESDRITMEYQKPKNIRFIDKTIFVCETDLAYGTGRMLQALHGIVNSKHKVVIVRSESELEDTINMI